MRKGGREEGKEERVSGRGGRESQGLGGRVAGVGRRGRAWRLCIPNVKALNL